MRSKESILHFVNYLNSKHLNIRFTWEEEKDDKLAFLDVCVYRPSGGFTTSIHCKSTFSGIYTNYESFILNQYKISLVSTLLHRAYMISSNHQLLHEEIVKVKEILKCNGYPGINLDKIIFRFLEKIYAPSVPITTVPRKIVTLVLPFMGTMSLDVKKKLSKSFKECVPLAKLQIVFKTNNRMSSWFRYKDVFPESLLSGVIYEYKCPRCNSRYQGSTFRYWEKRLEEHLHVSALTGKPLKGMFVFPPLEHSRKCGESINRDQFKIIGNERNRFLVRLKESIFIHSDPPVLI